MSLNPTGIESATHSWNPLRGCLHTTKECACSDNCYASISAGRFPPYDDFRKPMYYPKRLADVTPKQKPRVIFVGSMTDMMGKWWTDATIQLVIDRCRVCPQHIFMWLTKNPHRYFDFKWPDNCWIGASITSQADDWREGFLRDDHHTFVSYEPIMGVWKPKYSYDWIIAGCMTDGQGNPDPKYPVDIVNLVEIAKSAPLLIKKPLFHNPDKKQFPPEIKAIMDTWSK